ncbi:MAG: A/G-specific adenine glycosylase [Acidobacteria bacterium]|nr:A/G-specific adenine glycosylase [Acidobacteriota bacterium]
MPAPKHWMPRGTGVSPVLVRSFRSRLLRWFDCNRRDLPWRRTRNPYRIWLAEIMLQQTRVPVVLPFYERFLRTFPSLRRLATAPVDRVLRLWAGLGYYQRARNLHRAAKILVHGYGGCFPKTLSAALALPGVGGYTARAVLSIAYKKPLAVVDGNVARVLARVFRLRLDASGVRQGLQPLADRLVSPARPGDSNQALMELGSTVCLPRIPRCPICPLETLCAARGARIERAWPPRPAKRIKPRRRLAVLVLHRDTQVLLVRENHGLFSGLWHFPYAPRARLRTLPSRLQPYLRQMGVARVRLQPRFWLDHPMTSGNLHLAIYVVSLDGRRRSTGSLLADNKQRWVQVRQLEKLAIGAATRKIVAALSLSTRFSV